MIMYGTIRYICGYQLHPDILNLPRCSFDNCKLVSMSSLLSDRICNGFVETNANVQMSKQATEQRAVSNEVSVCCALV